MLYCSIQNWEPVLVREKNENNTKKFIDERKSQAIKQAKEREKLKKVNKQREKLKKVNKQREKLKKVNKTEGETKKGNTNRGRN